MVKVGDVVRIEKKWLSPSENPEIDYVVLEVLLPWRGQNDRNVKIYTKSDERTFGHTEMVSYDMIYKVGHIELGGK